MKYKLKSQEVSLIIFSTLIIVSYAIPLLYAYFNSINFTYVNAWDEETYLTYQGALGSLYLPGYSLGAIATLPCQELGISGSIQNLLFDIFLPSLTSFFTYKVLTHFKISKTYSFTFAILILFSSVLFNHANPVLAAIYPGLKITTIMIGYEGYASILRTPNPEISYFLLSICLYLYTKYKKIFILFIPLTFLYFFVAVPYLFLLTVYLMITIVWRSVGYKQIFTSSLVAYTLLSIGLIMMEKLFLVNNEVLASSAHYVHTHHIYIPLVFLVGLVFLIVQFFINTKYDIKQLVYIQFSILITIFFVANTQVLTGYILSYKNYYDYGFSLLAGMSIVTFLYSFHFIKNQNIKYILTLFFAMITLYLNLSSKGFDIKKMQYKIWMGSHIDNSDLEKIRKDSIHAIIKGSNSRAKVAYSNAKMIILPFSYQNGFPFIERQCRYNPVLIENAFNFVKKQKDSKYFSKAYERYKTLEKFKNTMYKDRYYCTKSHYLNKDFFMIETNSSNAWQYFPKYE